MESYVNIRTGSGCVPTVEYALELRSVTLRLLYGQKGAELAVEIITYYNLNGFPAHVHPSSDISPILGIFSHTIFSHKAHHNNTATNHWIFYPRFHPNFPFYSNRSRQLHYIKKSRRFCAFEQSSQNREAVRVFEPSLWLFANPANRLDVNIQRSFKRPMFAFSLAFNSAFYIRISSSMYTNKSVARL